MSLQTIQPAVCSTECSLFIPGAATKCFITQRGIKTDLQSCTSTVLGAIIQSSCEVTLDLSQQTCTSIISEALCIDIKSPQKTIHCTLGLQETAPGLINVASSTSSNASLKSASATPAISSTVPKSTFTTSASSNTSPTSISDPGQSSVSPGVFQQKDTGLGSGAVAGIAIGCIFAGAAIAGLILLFLFMRYKKRNQQQPISAYAQHVGHYPEQNKHEKSQITAVVNGVSSVDNYLPQPTADDAITGDLSRLRDKIKDHVQSYYHTSPVNSQVLDQNKLEEMAVAIGVPASRIKELLLNPHSRVLAIRLYLAWLILSRCGVQGQARTSFLPAEVASFAPVIAGMDSAIKSQVALASKWKSISGTLLQSRYGQQQSNEEDVLDHNIGQALVVADSVLQPFIGPGTGASSGKRLQNLEGIMRRAAKFAFVLFSQPSNWAFEWVGAPEGLQQGTLVVFPGLLQTVSDEGYAQRPPRLLTEAEVVSGL